MSKRDTRQNRSAVIIDKLNNLKPLHVALLLALVGLIVFSSGLRNPFQGDDNYQIVNNPVVHSITHIGSFFNGGTFYNNDGSTPLFGVWYRPIMTLTFSLLYTIFGLQPFYFHLLQLALYIGAAILLYMVLTHFMKPILALPLALIFLVHPINSQIVYAIPSMQEPLFFFFGILGFWLLLRSITTRELWLVALCLLLSLLSKESGLLFVGVAGLYLLWFDRERFLPFLGMAASVVALWLMLKIHAVGLGTNPAAAPIDRLNLLQRLMNVPEIVLFYISKFVFPWRLATIYHWVHPYFSIRYFLIPLLIDLGAVALLGGIAWWIWKRGTKEHLHTYLFFAVWVAVGLALHFQIVPLDMTVCEAWFYFAFAGLLGMIGIAASTTKLRFNPVLPLTLVLLVIGALGVRTAIRGTDYRSQYFLATRDLKASPEDYNAYNDIAQALIAQKHYNQAIKYAQHSIAIFPCTTSYNNLAIANEYNGNYLNAIKAYNDALHYGNYAFVYENLAQITLVYGSPIANTNFYQTALQKFPHDFKLWLYLAVFEDASGSNENAKIAINKAAQFGNVPPVLYNNIMNNQGFVLNLPISKYSLVIR